MIIIECSGEYAFGGRTEDIFVIENHDTLEELQTYIQNKQPIKCKEPTNYVKRFIIDKSALQDRLVYLNNYLKIRQVDFDLMNRDEIDQLYNQSCKKCASHDGTLSDILKCYYSPDGKGGCSQQWEHFSWLKNLSRKSK
ncbi:hypothetical protein [Paenibacillus naphthalenovorans]|uniref:Uncharacterized protein n=1 Tax=Paenibacillus naphthalenovorans TaxID=162209 RepID=A0A0U2U6Z7_9BACL|nr:hypothetical protein [Paenibacillus naphthalenovorans]ALS22137.1 hypothetical protein IJ22_17630 [Paenibacillus naphthalenovorans]